MVRINKSKRSISSRNKKRSPVQGRARRTARFYCKRYRPAMEPCIELARYPQDIYGGITQPEQTTTIIKTLTENVDKTPHQAPVTIICSLAKSFNDSLVTLAKESFITHKNINNSSKNIIYGIFLYTDEDIDMIKYLRTNLESLDILSGDWSKIYILEMPEKDSIVWVNYWIKNFTYDFFKQWFPLLESTKTKPFDRNQSYNIARDLEIPFDQLPCLVLLPPLTEISSQEKLIVPIKEISKEYFRSLFSTLENIVKHSENINKYEAVKIKFNTIIQYLEKNSQQVVQQTTTEYQINGTNIFVNSTLRSLDMSEQKFYGPVGGVQSGHDNNQDISQVNYITEEQQNLAQAAKEIQDLLNQLSQTYSPPSNDNNLKIATETVEAIEQNPTLKSRVISTLKAGGTEALKELINHPSVNILMALIEGWNSAE
ncbi:hypothetical protein [Crocosphaera sp. XPORK-15E]|uniref:hypothetical protein n=1 Tax=Crocosphaera sp. XPORK-15E TaxID=3110247 RepID=UPI002B200466|nr:hypothetical protein [Crocosphaera sp. XPORK-15E]MEA5536843.1 hypothetical protein [Crocosphaera sp. XPORK-15E]